MFNVFLQVTVSAMVISMMGGGSVEKFELRMTRAVANGQTSLPAFSPFLFCCYLILNVLCLDLSMHQVLCERLQHLLR